MPVTKPTASSIRKSRTPATPKRSPDAETSKPRVSKPAAKKPKAAPLPPPPEASSSEDEEAEDASDAESAVSEDETPKQEEVPVPATALATRARKTKTSKVKVKEPTDKKVAPHMALFLHSLPYESSPPEPRPIAYYAIDFSFPMEINHLLTGVMLSFEKVKKNNRSYNSISSRLGLSLAIYYKILLVQQSAGVISADSLKLLKRLLISHPPATIMIPSPYVHWLSTLGYHLPEDTKFDKVVPLFPEPSATHDLPSKTAKYLTVKTTPLALAYPSIPYLYSALDIISSKGEVKKQGASKADKDVDDNLHIEEDDFVLINRKGFQPGVVSFFGVAMTSGPTATSATDALSQNAGFLFPFREDIDELVALQKHLRPIPSVWKTVPEIKSVMDLFMASTSTDWMHGPFAALRYESKFFPGSSTLESLDVSSGPELTCQVHYEQTQTRTNTWYGSRTFKSRAVSVKTMNRHVTSNHLAIAHATRMVTKVTGPQGNLFRGFNSAAYNVKPDGLTETIDPLNVKTIYNEGYEQRGIEVSDYLFEAYEPTIRSMMDKISSVL
jgi:hypothetical protein